MTSSQQLRRLCIFSGSRAGAHPSYEAHARSFGSLLATQGIGIVYGGATVGLMGALSSAALTAGGEVIGVIPEALVAKELAHPSLSHLHVVGSMHERKALMAELSDAFVALPGGFGTFEEFFEMVTWAQLGIHAKPVGLLNTEGYYDPLMAFVHRAVGEGFITRLDASLIVVRSEPVGLLDALMAHRPPLAGPKWLEKTQT